jgi:glycine/D-amino acid oxidase-like deaminating enzyme
VDVLLSPGLVQNHFPYVTPEARCAAHYRRCGFLDPVLLGRELLAEAESRGALLVQARARALRVESGRIQGVEREDGSVLEADQVALACGPGLSQLAATAGVLLPLEHEAHWKLMLPDPRGVVPETAPLMILADPVRLEGETWERPGGAHLRPARRKGRREVHILWGYGSESVPPVFPLPPDPDFPRLALAGASRLVPGLRELDASHGEVTGGYYCKAPDNRPLLGPLAVEGLLVLGGLSGFGVMASQAAAELVAGAMRGDPAGQGLRPFLPSRFDDPLYVKQVRSQAGAAGQL